MAAWSRRGPDRAIDRLNRHLAADGMVPLGPIDLRLGQQHADYFTDSRAVYLAEVRALPLRDPNPFPPIRLWGRRRG